MMACPSCPRSWSTEETLAIHLMDAHALDAPTAAERARVVVRDAERQTRRMTKQAQKGRRRR